MDNVKRRLPPLVASAKPIELRVGGDFVEWLARSGGTLAATTYNSGKLALLSAAGGELAASFWRFPRPMGLAYADGQLAVASQQHIWIYCAVRTDAANHRYATVPSPRGEGLGKGDGRPVPASSPLPCPPLQADRAGGNLNVDSPLENVLRQESIYTTGRLDVHDLAFDCRGLVFANTRFNCIARPSKRVSFQRTWQPWFIGGKPRKDCCHLNGLGVREGRIAMATAFCEHSTPAAWRQLDRFRSGVLIDIRRNEIAARGLCMPHSPRWHAGAWWFCDSGRGALCRLNETYADACGGAAWIEVSVLPGFTRGLTFAAGRAVVGLSRIRRKHILDAPPVRERFSRLRSGLWLVDPATGRVTGALEFVRGGREVYDMAFLPGVQQLAFAAADSESPA